MAKTNRPPFRVVAHRGASAEAPENTVAAFTQAAALGATSIETDVRRTADGRLVLFHDRALQPKVERDGAAEDHTLAVLETMDIGTWFDREGTQALYAPEVGWERPNLRPAAGERVIGFETYLDRFCDAFFHEIELKGTDRDLPDLVLSAIRTHGLGGRAAITSFIPDHLHRARSLDADIPTGWLFGRPADAHLDLPDPAANCRRLGCTHCCPHMRVLTRELADRAHALGLLVRACGVRTPDDLRHAIACGADGATVNWVRPALAIARAATR